MRNDDRCRWHVIKGSPHRYSCRMMMSVTLDARQLSTSSARIVAPRFCVRAPGMSSATSFANAVKLLLGSRLVVTSTCARLQRVTACAVYWRAIGVCAVAQCMASGPLWPRCCMCLIGSASARVWAGKQLWCSAARVLTERECV